MKIGIDIRTLMDRHYSGVPEYSLNIIKNLIKIDRENEYILFFNSFKDISMDIPEFLAPNVSIVRTKYPNKLFSLSMKIFKYPKLDKLCKVDVFFMPHMNFASFSADAKKVITIHDLSFLRYPEFFSFKKNIWHRLVDIKKDLKSFDKIIAISENTKDDIVELCSVAEEKIEVISSGIADDFKVFPKDEPKLKIVKEKYKLPDKFIFSLGNIEPRKNIEGIISAFELMQNKGEQSDCHLVFAGAFGWKYKKIIKKWEKSAYKNKIHFLGFIDREDKPYLYNLASIFVYPSFYEGFGFPPLEAFASGLACISSANSSLSEVTKDAALLVDPYNTELLASTINSLLGSPKLRQNCINKGLKIVDTYKWDRSARETKKVLESF